LVLTGATSGGSAPDFVNVTVAGVPSSGAGCNSSITTVAALRSLVGALSASTQIVTVLQNTLATVQTALGSGRNKVARDAMALFIGEVTVASNLAPGARDYIAPTKANALVCGAANILISINPT